MAKDELTEILRKVAPGTALRSGLDNILRAKTGALIVLSDEDSIAEILDGGFKIDIDFTPANIYELCKMDGAIIVSGDLKKILRANVQLLPDHNIKTVETGTRHSTAERVAKQTDKMVICISQRRGIITIFKGDYRYVIKETQAVVIQATQMLETVEKYKKVLDHLLSVLTEHEFDDIVYLELVANVIYRSEQVLRMKSEVEKVIVELGNEGTLLNSQLLELVDNVEVEEKQIIQDYRVQPKTRSKKDVETILSDIRKLDRKTLLDSEKIIKLLGYESDSTTELLDRNVSPRGYRVLNKIPKMPNTVIEKIIDNFGSLQKVCNATVVQLDNVDGIGERRAKIINQSLKRLQEQNIIKLYNI